MSQNLKNILDDIQQTKADIRSAIEIHGVSLNGVPIKHWGAIIRAIELLDEYIDVDPEPEPQPEPPSPDPDEDSVPSDEENVPAFLPEPPPPEPPPPDFSELDPPPPGQRWATIWSGAWYSDGRPPFTLRDVYAIYEGVFSVNGQTNQIVRCQQLDVHGLWNLDQYGNRLGMRPGGIDVTGVFIRRTTVIKPTGVLIGEDVFVYHRKVVLLPDDLY